jgi:hypothetical protein
MAIVIDDPTRPETRILFTVDVGNGGAVSQNNFVRVGANGILDSYTWELGINGFLDVWDENGTVQSLIVQTGGVEVLDLDNIPTFGEMAFLQVFDVSAAQAVATPTFPATVVIQPGPPAQDEGGLVLF